MQEHKNQDIKLDIIKYMDFFFAQYHRFCCNEQIELGNAVHNSENITLTVRKEQMIMKRTNLSYFNNEAYQSL